MKTKLPLRLPLTPVVDLRVSNASKNVLVHMLSDSVLFSLSVQRAWNL